MTFTITLPLDPRVNLILPTSEYKQIKQDKIKTFSEGFYHTLQTLPTWRVSELPRCSGGGNQNNIRAFNQFHSVWGDPPLEAIDHDLVHEVIGELQEGTNNKNSTYNRAISMVKKVLHQCARSRYIKHVAVIDKFDEEELQAPSYYRKEHVARLIQLAREREDDAMAQAIQVAAYTGLRQAELRRLRVRDVDFYENVLKIGGTPESRTKGKNYREIPIAPNLMPIFEYRAASSRPYDGFIFDEFRNQWHLHRRWKAVLKILKREDRTIQNSHKWRSLRNSFVTWALDQGTPIMTVKKWAGHSSVTVTEGYKAKNNDHDHSEMERMACVAKD